MKLKSCLFNIPLKYTSGEYFQIAYPETNIVHLFADDMKNIQQTIHYVIKIICKVKNMLKYYYKKQKSTL